MMKITFLRLALTLTFAVTASAAAFAQGQQPITIRAARVIDGTGKVLTNATVEIQGSKITKVDQRTGPVTYDLGNVTVMPGMIDVHVHIGYHFGKDGRAQNRGETPAEIAFYTAENAWTTLVNGFTTVDGTSWTPRRGTSPRPRAVGPTAWAAGVRTAHSS